MHLKNRLTFAHAPCILTGDEQTCMVVHATPYRPPAEKIKTLYCLTEALLEKVYKNEITYRDPI